MAPPLAYQNMTDPAQSAYEDPGTAPAFWDWKYREEGEVVDALLASTPFDAPQKARIAQQTRVMVETTRARKSETKGFQSLMQSYDLSSEEGLALMCLAEALLRIPDSDTANALIEDKLGQADFDRLFGKSMNALGKISSFGLKMSQTVMGSMVGRLGMPVIRNATIQAMRLMGKTFVLGRSIEEAIKAGRDEMKKGYAYSYDMLGEGARTFEDAKRYFDAYMDAIETIGNNHDTTQHPNPLLRPGVSIKLSALHPRYDFANRAVCVPFLSEKLKELALAAARYNINLTVDAEEADRLGISIEIFETILKEDALQNWEGYGLAIQAYQKRAFPLIDHIVEMGQRYKRKIAIRLVKGAYWDSEIKHAQELCLDGYTVFTRKAHTDVSYIACAKKMLAARPHILPMFGTHNAQTVATILELAGEQKDNFAFQRLHGMGDGLYNQVLSQDIPCSIYAPVGTHEDLLAYLVRRLLENGANSSFVYRLYNEDVPIEELCVNPVNTARSYRESGQRKHPAIPMPLDIYGTERKNAKGFDLTERDVVFPLMKHVDAFFKGQKRHAMPVIGGQKVKSGAPLPITNPARLSEELGQMWSADIHAIRKAYELMAQHQPRWSATPAKERASCLMKLAALMEEKRDDCMALLIKEAGKTYGDAIAEIREAVDFCRYYALRGDALFQPEIMPGPTGERNAYMHEGRGIFVCISPWNFPMAIYTGQIVAALMAGNAVAIKPAEQTPLIAAFVFDMMLEAGIPKEVISFLPGDGTVGEMLVGHDHTAGVAFTGSTEVAQIINRSLAAKDGPIVPLIAETGGQNAMIVDSSALPEQVVDDVILSAFGSAGQRCSALRVLCLQNDIADKVIAMLKGAIAALNTGDPALLETDIGPVIDHQALAVLGKHRSGLKGSAKIVGEAPIDAETEQKGTFIAPVAAELHGIDQLEREVFGPILHIVRYDHHQIDRLVTEINATGYGLTFGVHSRLESFAEELSHKVRAGNVYINRGMTGAVVGVQPFGGHGMSGTGPKAGGPYYLLAFSTERSISTDTTASGGNATLVSLGD